MYLCRYSANKREKGGQGNGGNGVYALWLKKHTDKLFGEVGESQVTHGAPHLRSAKRNNPLVNVTNLDSSLQVYLQRLRRAKPSQWGCISSLMGNCEFSLQDRMELRVLRLKRAFSFSFNKRGCQTSSCASPLF